MLNKLMKHCDNSGMFVTFMQLPLIFHCGDNIMMIFWSFYLSEIQTELFMDKTS